MKPLQRKHVQGWILLAASVVLCSQAYADDGAAQEPQPEIGFDRPGIGFSTNIMPASSVALELGLPDFSYSKQKVAGQTRRDSVYQSDVLIRTGLGGNAELQLGWAGPMWARSKSAGQTQRESGYGDSSVGLKIAVPLPSQTFGLALLGASTLTTGDAEFGDDKRTSSFGATLDYQLNDQVSAALYSNLDRYDGENTWTLSPSISLGFTDQLAGFVEYGYSKSSGQPQQSVVGGGLTFMLCPRVQLDISADVGVNNEAPDVQGGFGISIAL